MDQKKYINRDISWLHFNARVLQEANDPNTPLIERIRFLGIHSNNLDEFFRVRYATIKRMSRISGTKQRKQLAGWSAAHLLQELTSLVIQQQKKSQEIYEELIAELQQHDVLMVNEHQLTSNQKTFVRQYFREKVSPAVVTLILSKKRNFPELKDKSIYLAVKLERKSKVEDDVFALIEIPSQLLGRFVILPRYGKQFIMYLDDLIRYNLDFIFFIFNYQRHKANTIKITRDAEIDIDDDVSKSFLEKMQRGLRHRKIADPVLFVHDKDSDGELLGKILEGMKMSQFDSLIAGGRYHNKKDLMGFPQVGKPELEHEKFENVPHPVLDMDRSMFRVVARRDVLLFLPYHSFAYLIRFLREAAIDPTVKQIKVSLYRLASESRIISALINAAKNGKDVTVVVELQARFDEENNIRWTNKLRAEGVKVIHGVPGLKVHTKITYVVKQQEGRLKEFAIVGTGNYHEGTAKIYTDYHLMTADKRITKEVKRVFDFFESNYLVQDYDHLIVSPHYTRTRFIELIDKEIENMKKGLPAGIVLKLNSLSDLNMIDKLYEASQYGVSTRLIIRGICSLIPQVPGLSENIEVISIVDRYLEHTRLFKFMNGGDPKFFISSADWMTRNIDHRVEVTAPIYDRTIKRQMQDHLDLIWKDNVKSRIIGGKEINAYKKNMGPRIRSQIEMYNYLQKVLKKNQLA